MNSGVLFRGSGYPPGPRRALRLNNNGDCAKRTLTMSMNARRQRKAFTLIELLVVIAIIALLLSILVPSLKRAKIMAQKTICMSHLKQWGSVYEMYLNDNKGYFPSSCLDPALLPRGASTWFLSLRSYYQDPQIMFCPASISAPDPKPDYFNNRWQWEFGWWQSTFPDLMSNTEIAAITGSYGENWWITSTPSEDSAVYPDQNKYKRSGVRGVSPGLIPVIGDSGAFLARPTETSNPPENDGDYTHIHGDEMRRICTDRHSTGSVNWVFADISVQPVGLKQLWQTKWHKNWNPRIPLWPEWMRKYPD